MSKIIIPDDVDIDNLSKRERKNLERDVQRQERELLKSVRLGDLPGLVTELVDPAMSALYRQIRLQFIASQSIREILIANGTITEEEFAEMFDKTAKKLSEESEPVTPNSPALEESKKASEGRKVERLNEVPPKVTEDAEGAPRRLREG